MDTDRHCETMVQEADKDRFLSALFAPAAKRNGLFALYAFDIEVARVRTLSQQPLPGEVRLQWWRDVLARERDAEAQGNPVSAALLGVVGDNAGLRAALQQLLDARSFELYDEPMQSYAELEAHCRDTAGAVMCIAAQLLQPELGSEALHAAAAAGTAAGLSAMLRSLPVHLCRGQMFLPADLLAQHGADPAAIQAGLINPAAKAVLADIAARARAQLHTAAEAQLPVATWPALMPAVLVPLYLDAVRKRDNPLRILPEVPQWKRQWALWRASRELPRRLKNA